MWMELYIIPVYHLGHKGECSFELKFPPLSGSVVHLKHGLDEDVPPGSPCPSRSIIQRHLTLLHCTTLIQFYRHNRLTRIGIICMIIHVGSVQCLQAKLKT